MRLGVSDVESLLISLLASCWLDNIVVVLIVDEKVQSIMSTYIYIVTFVDISGTITIVNHYDRGY